MQMKNIGNKKVLAIDNASKLIGWAFFFAGDLHDYGVINLSKVGRRADDRVLAYHRELNALMKLLKPDEVVIETPGGGGTGWSLRVLSEFLGIVKVTALRNKIPFFLMSPKEAKKGSAGTGNASKAQIQEWAHNTYTDLVNKDVTEDEADAIAIAHAYIKKSSEK